MTSVRRRLLVGSGLLSGAQLLRAVLQAAYFIMLARALGAEQYGALASIVAATAAVAPFASLGAGNLLVKRTATDRNLFARYWGAALLTTVISSVLLLVAVSAVMKWLFPSLSLAVVMAIALADLVLARLSDVAAQALQARSRLGLMAVAVVGPSVARVLAAVMLLVLGKATLGSWSTLYLLASAGSALCILMTVTVACGRPERHLLSLHDLREGLLFAVSLAAQTVYNDIDKTMLARLGSFESVGIYSSAYRLIDTAFTPVRAVLASAYSEFFRRGADGLRATTRFALRLAPPVLLYSILSSLALVVAAPLAPVVLGSSFEPSISAVRWLAAIPVLRSVHYLAADALTGAGFQGRRTAIQIAVAVGNVAANVVLIRAYDWHGAVYASLLADGALAVGLWAIVARLLSQSGPNEEAPTDTALSAQ